jgi:hypothetical protein
VFVIACYPVNPQADFGLDKSVKAVMFATRTNASIAEANAAAEEPAKRRGFHFIHVNEGFGLV